MLKKRGKDRERENDIWVAKKENPDKNSSATHTICVKWERKKTHKLRFKMKQKQNIHISKKKEKEKTNKQKTNSTQIKRK